VDPSSQHPTGPTTVTTGISPHGAAAAVCGGAIYGITVDSVVSSADGKSYAKWTFPSGNSLPATQVLDAVTFYSTDTSPAGIMVVYNGRGDPADLEAAMFYPPVHMWYGGLTLPWPPVSPHRWAPVTQGNLVLGTSADYPAPGAKVPCVQFYGMTASGQDGQHLGRWEYNLANQSWTFHDWTQGGSLYKLGVWPWFDTMATNSTMRLSHVMDVQFGNTEKWYANRSDWMVPQHDDSVYGWAGAPTVTSTATSGSDDDNKRRALWSLVGLVIGPPPFALNGIPDASWPLVLSQVQYGIDQSQSVTTTLTSSQTISVAMNNSIQAGFGEFNLDLSYAHAWTSSYGTTHTVETSTYYTFGPMDETPPDQGTHGWAIFNAPTFVTQQYKVYAYDYNQSTGTGTYLNQDIYATSVGAVVPQTAYFTLANPANGAIQNLMQGFPIYPNSTDIAHWFGIQDWNNGGSNWTAIFGDHSSPAVGTLNVGTDIQQTYAQTDTTNYSKGNNNSFSISAGASFDVLEGFSTGVTVGYDAEFGTETDVASTITKSVSCSLNMPIPPNTPGYVNSMTTQPYWLQAKTAKAPWIPTGYSGNLPWCITWDVLQYSTVGGTTVGVARSPLRTSGTIRRGNGNKLDTYKIVMGRLAWLDPNAQETPLGMTADDFDPALGATVFLNGHAFSPDARQGKWYRRGDVWTYRTLREGATDSFTLDLDLANKTWSFDGSARNLDQQIKAADDSLRVELEVQGEYWFAQWVKHNVAATWSHAQNQAAREPYGVHALDGAYNSQKGVGHLNLNGHIPKSVTSFGDLELRINTASVSIPLLPLPGFWDALHRRRALNYKAKDVSFEIDFGTGMWKAILDADQFKSGMAPQGGAVRVQVVVGGERRSDQAIQVENYTTTLTSAALP
jgi:hypothetical protein